MPIVSQYNVDASPYNANASTTAWILVLNPPLLRPITSVSVSPFSTQKQDRNTYLSSLLTYIGEDETIQ
ncbi:hypothetical protein [Nostoc sp.]|uniref:hypothetical protein n=1 Tax=Nostoc sp. TaxID=1180 RepID=UPI002FF4F136